MKRPETCAQIQEKTRLRKKTSFTESGLTASVRPKDDEKVAFYRTDDVAFREAFGLTREPACDLVVHVAKGERDILAFVELKGVDAGEGVAQIESTYRAIKTCLRQEADRRRRKDVNVLGLVLARGPSPRRESKVLPIKHKTLPKKTKTYDFGPDLW